MKTYVITLPATDRHLKARAYFEEYGWPVEYWHGVDGHAWNLTTSNTIFDSPHKWPMSKGSLGCALSHWSLWNHVLHSPDDPVLILEDDAYFADPLPEFRRRLDQCLTDMPPHWQIFYAGYCASPAPTWRQGSIGSAYWPQCTHAYAIRKSAAEVLLSECWRNNHHIDVIMAKHALPKLHHFLALEPLIRQHTLDGDWLTQAGV